MTQNLICLIRIRVEGSVECETEDLRGELELGGSGLEGRIRIPLTEA